MVLVMVFTEDSLNRDTSYGPWVSINSLLATASRFCCTCEVCDLDRLGTSLHPKFGTETGRHRNWQRKSGLKLAAVSGNEGKLTNRRFDIALGPSQELFGTRTC